MKMAKASKADMDMALKLCSALEAIDRRFFPEGSEGNNDPEDFGLECDEHCGVVLRHLYDILQGGSIGRVIYGMYVMLDPDNKIVDPDADTLEDHPNTVAAMKDAERWKKISALMFIGNVELNQDEDGGYSISVDPVENIVAQSWAGNSPEEAIDAAPAALAE